MNATVLLEPGVRRVVNVLSHGSVRLVHGKFFPCGSHVPLKERHVALAQAAGLAEIEGEKLVFTRAGEELSARMSRESTYRQRNLARVRKAIARGANDLRAGGEP